MLDDLDYIESIKNIITDQLIKCRKPQLHKLATILCKMFRAMDDPYMREKKCGRQRRFGKTYKNSFG